MSIGKERTVRINMSTRYIEFRQSGFVKRLDENDVAITIESPPYVLVRMVILHS